MSARGRAGVTLIELLIAVSLVGLLAVGLLTAMRVGLAAMQKVNTRVIANRKALGVQRILEQQVAGLMPVSADCMGGGGPAPTAKILFFQGDVQTMRFVSAYSLEEAARGYPRILEYQVIPGERNEGVRLVVNEHLYTGGRGAGLFCLGMGMDPALGVTAPRFRPVEVNERSFVLADRLAYCRFLYRQVMPLPAPARWVPRWVFEHWPSAVRIEMAPLEADPTRIQPRSFTAPVMVNKVALGTYVD
jgi:prepilin-type N-terminal cleavage/methylation domain-containing protein